MRRLGGCEKKAEVRKLVSEQKPFILCHQETKLSIVDEYLCASLWRGMSRGFSFRSSVRASGGLPIIWNSDEMEVCSYFLDDHLLLNHGKFILTDEEFYLINLYAPCDVATQQLLWERLKAQIGNYVGRNLCVCGDFNVVCSLEERIAARTFFKDWRGLMFLTG